MKLWQYIKAWWKPQHTGSGPWGLTDFEEACNCLEHVRVHFARKAAGIEDANSWLNIGQIERFLQRPEAIAALHAAAKKVEREMFSWGWRPLGWLGDKAERERGWTP